VGGVELTGGAGTQVHDLAVGVGESALNLILNVIIALIPLELLSFPGKG